MTSNPSDSPTSPIEERYQETVRWSRNGQFDEAIHRYRELLEEDPEHIGCQGQIAYLHELKGEVEEAIECYRRIIEIHPDLAIARLRLGNCYFGIRDRKSARKAYLSLSGTELFHLEEVQMKLSLTDSFPRKLVRRSIPLAGAVLKKAFDPKFLRALGAELANVPKANSAIREVGALTYLAYLSQHFLQGDWYRRPKLPCDLCGGNRFETVFYHRFQKVVRCRGCGLETVERKPDQGLDVFTDYYEKEETVREFESLGWNDEQHQQDRIEKIRSLFEGGDSGLFPRTGLRVFEIGFGEGYLLKAFQDLGCQVKGIETSRRLVQYARERLKLPVDKMTVRDLRAEDGPFDFIVAFHVLEHLDSPSLLLGKARRMLAEGGRLFLEIPVAELAAAPLAKKLDPSIGYANLYHMSFFTPSTARKLFEKGGFEVVGEYTLYPDTHPTMGFLLKTV